MDQHNPRLLEKIVERHCFSLGVVRGLLERHAEATFASVEGRCAIEDVHGGFVSTNIRQNLWIDLQEHARDQRGPTLKTPSRRGLKRESLVLVDGEGTTMRVRKHPRLPYSAELEPVVAEQPTLDDDLFGGPVCAPLYVLFDLDPLLGSLAGSWLATVSDFDVNARRAIHGRVPLPAAPAVLLPGSIEPLRVADAADMTFDDLLAATEEPGDEPA